MSQNHWLLLAEIIPNHEIRSETGKIQVKVVATLIMDTVETRIAPVLLDPYGRGFLLNWCLAGLAHGTHFFHMFLEDFAFDHISRPGGLNVFGGRRILPARKFLLHWWENGRQESNCLFVSLNRSETIDHCLGLCLVVHFVYANRREWFHVSCPRFYQHLLERVVAFNLSIIAVDPIGRRVFCLAPHFRGKLDVPLGVLDNCGVGKRHRVEISVHYGGVSERGIDLVSVLLELG